MSDDGYSRATVLAAPVQVEAGILPEDLEQYTRAMHHLGAITNPETLLAVMAGLQARVTALTLARQAAADAEAQAAAEGRRR